MRLTNVNSERGSPHNLSAMRSLEAESPTSHPTTTGLERKDNAIINCLHSTRRMMRKLYHNCTLRKLQALIQAFRVSMWFYINYTNLENKRHRFNFCLGFVSCTVAVVVAVTVSTLVDNAPFVILKQAEDNGGQYDFEISPAVTPFINLSAVRDVVDMFPIDGISSNMMASRRLYEMYDNYRNALTWGPACTDAIEITDDMQLYHDGNRYCGIALPDNGCFHTYQAIPLVLIDFETEEKLGIGREYPKHLYPGEGEAVLTFDAARKLDAAPGDYILIRLPVQNAAYELLASVTNKFGPNRELFTVDEEVAARDKLDEYGCISSVFPLYVKDVINKNDSELAYGKIGQAKGFGGIMILTEGKTFYRHVWKFAPNELKNIRVFNDVLSNDDYNIFEQFSKSIVVVMEDRYQMYVQNDYQVINALVSDITSKLMFLVGFNMVYMTFDLLGSLQSLRFASLFLQLILDVILFMMILLSVLLLYMLLIVSVETRTFELGVLRMVGLFRTRIVKLLLAQALSYTVASVAVGFIIAQLILFVTIPVVSDLLSLDLSSSMTLSAVLRGLGVGLVIPVFASILPIRNALSQNLHESLDHGHSNATMQTLISLKSSDSLSESDVMTLVVGLCLICFGFGLYYLLPFAIVSTNLSLLLAIFFVMIGAMLIGLLLFAFNVQPLLERFLVLILIQWFEKPCIPHIVIKNLMAHRERNKKTTLMYAASLGFVILVSVSTIVQTGSVKLRQIASVGGKYRIKFVNDMNAANFSEVDRIMTQLAETINLKYSYGYSTDAELDSTEYQAWHWGKLAYGSGSLALLSPDWLDVADVSLLNVQKEQSDTSMTLSEQVYTASGSQSVLMPDSFAESFSMKSIGEKFWLSMDPDQNGVDTKWTSLKALAYTSLFPGNAGSSFVAHPKLGLSVSKYFSLQQTVHAQYDSVEDLPVAFMLVTFSEETRNQEINQFFSELKDFTEESFDFRKYSRSINETQSTMDFVFNIATYVALFLCLFSLVGSMYTNIFEQSKEVAVYRSMGLSKYHTYRVYIYESVILVLGSAILGLVVGTAVGFTMSAQQSLYTNLPLYLELPMNIIIVVIIASLVSSILSVIVPIFRLLSNPVSYVMRTII